MPLTDQQLQTWGRWRRRLILCLLVSAWYYFSYKYNVYLKAWLSASRSHQATHRSLAEQDIPEPASHPFLWLSPITLPLLLAIFFTNTSATVPWVLHASSASPQLLEAWLHAWRNHTLDMLLMCASTMMGTAAITVVYEYGSIQLVQVARSLGPLCTTLWALLLLDQPTKGKSLVCLLLSLGGTMLASWKEPSLCLMTALLMTSANACMTFRNVITRRLLASLGITHQHAARSPRSAYSADVRGTHKERRRTADCATADFSSVKSTHMASALLTTGNAAACIVLVSVLAISAAHGSRSATLLLEIHPGALKQLLILGSTNWAYNLASQLVLAQVPVVSHGMLELLKRVFVLVAVSLFSQSPHWQPHNIVGAVITFIAAALYFHFSHKTPVATVIEFGNTHTSKQASYTSDGQQQQHDDVLNSPTRHDQFGHPSNSWQVKGDSRMTYRAGDSSTGTYRESPPVVAHIATPKSSNAASGFDSRDVVVVVQASGKGRDASGEESGSPRSSTECEVLPKSRRGRISLAQAAIIIIMLLSIPLLMPSTTWSMIVAGGKARLQAARGGGDVAVSGLSAVPVAVDPTNPGSSTSRGAGTTASNKPAADLDGDDASSSSKENGGDDDDAGPVSVTAIPVATVTTTTTAPAVSEPKPATNQATDAGKPKDEAAPSGKQAPVPTPGAADAAATSGVPDDRQDTRNSNLEALGKYHFPDNLGSITLDAVTVTQPGKSNSKPADSSSNGSKPADSSSSSGNKPAESQPAQEAVQDAPGASEELMGFYVGWLGHDNLGDEIVADIFFDLFKIALARQAPKVADIQVVRQVDTQLGSRYAKCNTKDPKGCQFAVIGGGSTVDVVFLGAAKDLLASNAPVFLFGGGYQRVAPNMTQQQEMMDLLITGNVLGGIRGPVTDAFMNNMTGSSLPIIRDSGLLAGALYPGRDGELSAQLPARIGTGRSIPNWPVAPECLKASNTRRLQQTADGGGVTTVQAAGIDSGLDSVPSDAAVTQSGGAGQGSVIEPGQQSTQTSNSRCERPLAVMTLRSELSSFSLHNDGKYLAAGEAVMEQPRNPVAVMALLIEALVNNHNFQVVLQSVDGNSLKAHTEFLDLLNQRIKPGHPKVLLHNENQDWYKVMDLYERAAVSVNCRLHSGVLAAAALRPTVYMAALPKFDDFMRSIDQADMLMNPDSPTLQAASTAELAKLLLFKVLDAVDNAADISATLERLRDDTLFKYNAALDQLVLQLRQQQPVAFAKSVAFCKQIAIKRGPCVSSRSVISVQCLKAL